MIQALQLYVAVEHTTVWINLHLVAKWMALLIIATQPSAIQCFIFGLRSLL